MVFLAGGCLRSGGEAKGDLVEVQGGGQLGRSLRGVGEEKAVIIDVDLQRQAIGLKSISQELEAGQECFLGVKPGRQIDPAEIIQKIEQGRLPVLIGQPTVRGGIVLPELTNFLGLPAADGFASLGRLGGRQAMGEGEAADRGPVRFKSKAAEKLGSDRAIRGMGFEQFDCHGAGRLRPGRALVSARLARRPLLAGALAQGREKALVEAVEALAADA